MTKTREGVLSGFVGKNPGGVLLSHTATRAVPSAPKSLTSEFGMGSGVASSKSPPETVASAAIAQCAYRAGGPESLFLEIARSADSARKPNPARDFTSRRLP